MRKVPVTWPGNGQFLQVWGWSTWLEKKVRTHHFGFSAGGDKFWRSECPHESSQPMEH